MSVLGDLMSTLFDRRPAWPRPGRGDARSIEVLCHDLLSSRGEVSGTALVRAIFEAYDALDDAGRHAFFRFLNSDLDLDAGHLRQALDAYDADPGTAEYRQLMQSTEPRRQELARRMNQLPGATERLVRMRGDLLRALPGAPELYKLDLDLRHLFKSWFNRGFLVLLPINWESPAYILEKIIAYEAVHAIDSWDDLRRRLQPDDRRCYGFFHPAMPDEPLIFVEVALTKGVASSIQSLLAAERTEIDAAAADTAVFYSISNCQEGLAGISFGNSLIKQVVEDLDRSLPGIKNFVTLSPVPGLMDWLRARGAADAAAQPERRRELAALYLTTAKSDGGAPLDPVARFHLKNGASLDEIHADGDTSPAGQARAGGAMVNYRYDLARIGRNHESFVGEGTVVTSGRVQNILRNAEPLDG